MFVKCGIVYREFIRDIMINKGKYIIPLLNIYCSGNVIIILVFVSVLYIKSIFLFKVY